MLVNCVVYQDGKKLADIQPDEIHDYIASPTASSGSPCATPRRATLHQMQQQFGLHELAVEDARHGHQRPKIEEYGDSLFAVLHMIELDGDELRGRRGRHLRRPQLRAVGAQPRREGLPGRARALRARARPAPARHRLRAVCADGRGGRPLFPGPRRARDRARGHRGAHLRGTLAARQHRGAVRPEAEADDAQARGRPAAGRRGQARTAGACRSSAPACASTSATSTTTCCA